MTGPKISFSYNPRHSLGLDKICIGAFCRHVYYGMNHKDMGALRSYIQPNESLQNVLVEQQLPKYKMHMAQKMEQVPKN